jgi:hypothetical protein
MGNRDRRPVEQEDEETMAEIRHEVDAMPEGCERECCREERKWLEAERDALKRSMPKIRFYAEAAHCDALAEAYEYALQNLNKVAEGRKV